MPVTWQTKPLLLQVAEAANCAAACTEVYAAHARWICRMLNDEPPFYTLGAASYLDLRFATGSINEYLSHPRAVWASTGPAVATLLDDVRGALACVLDAPVEYAPQLPSPGFHIFIGRAIPQVDCTRCSSGCRSCHFDLQHTLIPWERWYSDVDASQTLSFTLPINLPAAGGGLTIWKSLTLDQFGPSDQIEIPTMAYITASETIRYALGHLVLHDGHVLHQVAAVSPVSVTDERITLQGHGILADDAWRLYW
jgi:hypothetical protein